MTPFKINDETPKAMDSLERQLRGLGTNQKVIRQCETGACSFSLTCRPVRSACCEDTSASIQ